MGPAVSWYSSDLPGCYGQWRLEVLFTVVVVEMEPRASHIPGRHFTSPGLCVNTVFSPLLGNSHVEGPVPVSCEFVGSLKAQFLLHRCLCSAARSL